MPVIALFYLHRGLEYSDFFLVLIVWVVTSFFMEVPTGAFADKHGPKHSFIVGQTIKLAATTLLIIATGRWLFSLYAFLSAFSWTFFSGSDQAFIYESLKELGREDEMSKVWGRIHSAKFVPAVITILIGAYVARDLTESQFILLILLGLAFNTVTLFLLFLLVPPSSFARQAKTHSLQHVREGWRNLQGQRDLMLLFINECLVMIPTYVIITDENLIQPYFRQAGLPVVFIGVVYAIDSLGSAVALNRIAFFEKIFGQKPLTVITGLAIGVAFTAGAFLSPTIGIALAVFFTVKIAFWIRYPVFSHIKNRYIPSASRATTLSLLSMVDSTFDIIILSTLAFVSGLGITKVFLACAIIVFIGLCFPVKVRPSKNESL